MIVTASRLKRLNTALVLSEVRRQPGISRRELSRRLHSTDASLSRLTRDLIETGFLTEHDAATPVTGPGRPNIGLFLNPARLHVLCIVLSRYARVASVVGLDGQRIHETALDPAPDTAARLAAQVQALAARPELGLTRLAGISLVAAPGPEAEALGQTLRDTLAAPVAAFGIAEALHIAETWEHPGSQASLLVHAGFSLRASLITPDTRPLIAAQEGVLDAIPLGPDPAPQLREVAAADQILRALGHAAPGEGDTGLSLGVPHAIRQANAGDPRAHAAFRAGGEALGRSLMALTAVLRPARVLLAGPLAQAAPYLAGFRAALAGVAVTRSTISDLQGAEAVGLERFAFAASIR